MSPVIMSPSIDVKKDALVNLVKAHYKKMKMKNNKVDLGMEAIMLQVVKDEAERQGIDISDSQNMIEVTKLIDVNLISKIEGYIELNKRLSEPETDLNKLKKMKTSDFNL